MPDKIEVLKTYKTYVGGAFVRSESGHSYKVTGTDGKVVANACRCTRKDVRDAMTAARGAFPGWMKRSAYNRGQILYRIAEMLQGRKQQFLRELTTTGFEKKSALKEVETAIDRLIYYAGWTDKYPQVFGTINPVASAHFNFSNPDPTGIVGIIVPELSPLNGLVSMIAPVIAGGNVVVALTSEKHPLPAVSFGEVLHASDVPAGIVNILTGFRDELVSPLTTHMDLNAVWNTLKDSKMRKQIDENGALNIKRIYHSPDLKWYDTSEGENPYFILNFQEIKTTWHPAGF